MRSFLVQQLKRAQAEGDENAGLGTAKVRVPLACVGTAGAAPGQPSAVIAFVTVTRHSATLLFLSSTEAFPATTARTPKGAAGSPADGGVKGRRFVGLQQLRRIVARSNPPENKAVNKSELSLRVRSDNLWRPLLSRLIVRELATNWAATEKLSVSARVSTPCLPD